MLSRRIFSWIRYGARAGVVNATLAFLVLTTAPAAGDTVRIVALGDSLTAGYGLARGESFPVQLEAALEAEGIDAVVENAGVSGDTSAGGRARLDWALAPGADGEADILIVELGANDGLRGLDPAATEANIAAILETAKDRGVAVLLTGMMAPPNLGREYTAEFNALYPRLAEKHGVAFYPFFLEGVAADPKLNQRDGIHPTAEGVGVIVAGILPKVKALIEAL